MQKGSNKRGRLPSLGLALLASFVVLLALPLTSLGDLLGSTGGGLGSTVGGLVNGVTNTVQTTVQQVAPAASPVTSVVQSVAPPASHAVARSVAPASHAVARAVTPASAPRQNSDGYTPPMYGTNPHGQGTVAAVGLNPSPTVPYAYSPGGSSGSGEAVVVGRGRSEQSGGSYDAHTTIVALLGNELLGVNATPGQSNSGPLNPVQTAILDNICANTNEAVCLTVLAADTSASSNGASTHFEAAGLSSQQIAGLNASAASSDSSISQNGNCQTSSGDSSLANVGLASGPVASLNKSSESSTACSGQAPTQQSNSSVIGLGGNGVPLPAPGCANGTPNTEFSLLAPVLPIYCNADSTGQASDPAGVREALTVMGLQTGTGALTRVTTAASESHAVAPSSTTPSTPTTPATPGSGAGASGSGGRGSAGNGSKKSSGSGNTSPGNGTTPASGNGSSSSCTDSDPDCGVGPNGEPEANRFAGQITTAKSSSSLPFTGQNVLEVILVGLILAGVGLALSRRGRTPFSKRS